jgi:hypothetical protein
MRIKGASHGDGRAERHWVPTSAACRYEDGLDSWSHPGKSKISM